MVFDSLECAELRACSDSQCFRQLNKSGIGSVSEWPTIRSELEKRSLDWLDECIGLFTPVEIERHQRHLLAPMGCLCFLSGP
jgi:hypothetical protein